MVLSHIKREEVMHQGKCPKCEATITHAYIQNLEAKVPFGAQSYHAVSYQCPSCRTVLGIQMDPIALKTDTVTEVSQAVRAR